MFFSFDVSLINLLFSIMSAIKILSAGEHRALDVTVNYQRYIFCISFVILIQILELLVAI